MNYHVSPTDTLILSILVRYLGACLTTVTSAESYSRFKG